MSLNVIKYYLTKNRCYQRNVKRKPVGIQLHTIGTAQGTAQAVADYWNQASVSACVHYIVDCDTPGKVLYTLPEDVRCWGDAGWGNDNLISFEICESDFMSYKGGGASYTITNASKFKDDIMRGYNTSVLLCADICKRYGWDPEAKLPNGMYLISSHDEGRKAGISSAHVDPEHIWPRYDLTMAKFRADVKAAMGGNVVIQPQTEEVYRVRKTWTDVESQLFAGTLEGAKKACLPGYSVYDENGKIVYTLKKDGFQAADLKGLTEAERIEKIAPLYQDSMRKKGMLASVGIAQFCLESGYGATDLAEFANNLHGMKKSLSGNTWSGSVWDGVSVYGKESPEVYNGVTRMEYSEFRKYPNCETSIADRAAYFINAMNGSEKRYKGIVGNKDYKAVINIIKNGGYATDPEYVNKLTKLVERWNLYKYDDVEIPETGNADILPENIKWYRVRLSWGTGMDAQIGAYE
ncbi:MAG: glucosaminidase domain-containing protein, partial [Ruminococcus sp.]|nr:glucosaminidase domain-containing protein [Ruminococcus sp.]